MIKLYSFKIKKISALLLLPILILAISESEHFLYSKSSDVIGKINHINKHTREIIITAGGKKISMGKKVYIRLNNEIIVMKVHFPMMTQSKCKLLFRYRKYIKKLKKGMKVYSNRPPLEKKEENYLVGNYFLRNKYTTKDKHTGLIWKTCSEGLSGINCDKGKIIKYNWIDATIACLNLNLKNFAGKKNWHLPTKEEFATIIDKNQTKPLINNQAFPNTESFFYWSSNGYKFNSNFAWNISFINGEIIFNYKTIKYHARCVSK